MSGAPRSVQVVVDCRDALTLADWWAETLGWSVEQTDESFIRSMLEQGHASQDDTTTHHGRLVWRGASAITPTPDDGPERFRVLFMDVPEPKSTKNRLHLDVRCGAAGKDAVRAELEARGASYLRTGQQGPHSWHVMLDPEGNEFCIG